ncbi:hypothetical protein HRbin36_00365 [bacterium HR36]|nr:hypothetical protein HRbin36_00365 [bacterium HR36]
MKDGCFVELLETRKCRRCLQYFLWHYTHIYDAQSGEWIRFHLWPAQWHVADALVRHRQIVILKARQLGLSWLVLGYALWRMLFHPAATVLLFSRRQEEAEYLLGEERLRGMFRRLPTWMQLPEALRQAANCWVLANGSVARAFPSNAGDSYTATLAILDEADLVPNFDCLLRSVKPTIDGGGQIIVLSRVNKAQPGSPFQRLYREAKTGRTSWHPIFLPWNARPDRSPEWYAAIRQDILARTGALDELYEQYPSCDTEALAPRQAEKRFPLGWLQACFQELSPLHDLAPSYTRRGDMGQDETTQRDGPVHDNGHAPLASQKELAQLLAAVGPQLTVYRLPQVGRRYVLGADPAEGNPQSDSSAAIVFDADGAEEVAVLNGRFEPAVFAQHLAQLATLYNAAAILVERKQHGHAVLLWLREHATQLPQDRPRPYLLAGTDGRLGWLTTSNSKAALLTHLADQLRQRRCILHHRPTLEQLANLDGATLRAPAGQADDLAIAFALAVSAASQLLGPAATIRAGGQTTFALP